MVSFSPGAGIPQQRVRIPPGTYGLRIMPRGGMLESAHFIRMQCCLNPMARPRTAGSPDPEVTFEQAMSELEGIVHVLEDSRLPLDELVEKYERGAGLLKVCQQRLNAAQQRIELITRNDSEAPELEAFAAGGEENAETAAPSAAPAPKTARKTSPPANSDEIRLF